MAVNDRMRSRENVVVALKRGLSRTKQQGMWIAGHVIAVLFEGRKGLHGEILTPKKWVWETSNIVTDAGDLYYAERGIDASPTNFTTGATFDGIMELYSSEGNPPFKAANRGHLTGTLAPSSGQAMDGTYPLLSDPDGDNTGSGVDIITYRRSYTTAQANASSIDDVVITNPSPGASEALLMWADGLGNFTKTASDTLKVFVNHEFLGV